MPDTVTVLFGASTLLLTAVIVTVPLLEVLPAAIVSVLFVVIVKSLLVAGLTAVAETVTDTAALEAPDSVAVTVLVPPFSEIEAEPSASVTVGVLSSSVMVSVWFGRIRHTAAARDTGYRHRLVRRIHIVVVRGDRHRAGAGRRARRNRQNLVRRQAEIARHRRTHRTRRDRYCNGRA